MSALAELAPSLLTAVRGIIAAFGCLCIVIHAVIPCLVTVGEIVVYELPTEIAKWQLMKAQQMELQTLELRVATLAKRRARQKREEALRAHEDYQTQANRRLEVQRQKQMETERQKRNFLEEEEHDVEDERTRAHVCDTARPSSTQATATPQVEETSIPKRPNRGLRLRSPNIKIDRRPVPAYLKASAGVTKLAGDSDCAHRVTSSKARILSLGSIFDEGADENTAPVPRMWAH